MRNIFLDAKIKKELREFKEFKSKFNFEMKELKELEDGSIFYDDICVREGADGEWVGETDKFVNVGYRIHGPNPKVLSNLFPYKIYFKGFYIESLESIFQGIKFKDKKAQRMAFKYFGLNSNNIKALCDYDWKQTGEFYFQGKKIVRDSKEYDDFIDELYVSAIQNPLYRNALKNVGEKYILHAMGGKKKEETAFTRYEFERELNCLKSFVQKNN
jgi:hypothetical protein